MSIPLLAYPTSSQNHRVQGFEVPGDDQPFIYFQGNLSSAEEVEQLITAAYRQVFHEQQMLASNRQMLLESQLKAQQITVKEFVRGLVLSDAFRRLNFEVNSNYRFVEICIQRLLGRSVYNDREKIAWSIVLATEGVVGLVDGLLNSEEYLNNFGDHIVPYQRRRVLPTRTMGEVPFARTARYGTEYRDQLPESSFTGNYVKDNRMSLLKWNPPTYTEKVGTFIAYFGGAFATFLVLSTFLSFFGLISL